MRAPTSRPDPARAHTRTYIHKPAWYILTSLVVTLCLALAASASGQSPPSERALSLRNLGLAQLENEKNKEAEETYRQLIKAAPRDPLPHANLAVSLLRQQQDSEALEAIDNALELAPGRADLLAIRADILAWSGSNDEALRLYRQAFAAEPNNPELVYALYRHADVFRDTSADVQQAADEALQQMVRLRPDNLVVLLKSGQRAIERSDRTAASQVYLRIRELVWAIKQPNRRMAETVLPRILEALEEDDLASAKIPSLQLGNVLLASGAYKSGLVEFFNGIQGIPIRRLLGESAPSGFGTKRDRNDISFSSTQLSDSTGTGALIVGDWNDDGRADIAWGRMGTTVQERRHLNEPKVTFVRVADAKVEIRNSGTDPFGIEASAQQLVLADLDNDVQLDLIVLEEKATLRAPGIEGSFTAPTNVLLDKFPVAAGLSFFDFDSDGDLDIASIAASENSSFTLHLHRNDGSGSLTPVGGDAFETTKITQFTKILTADIDRDGDHDVLVVTKDGVTWLDNLRQGSFRNRTRSAGLARAPGAKVAALGDLDNNGGVDLLLAGTTASSRAVVTYQSQGNTLRAGPSFEARGEITDAILFDADNDGLLDVALATSEGVEVFLRRGTSYTAMPSLEKPGNNPKRLVSVRAEDADADGDLDLFATGPSGLFLYTNQGGNKNGWLRISLRGLTNGNDKNNAFGIGTSVEVMIGGARQYREARSPITHIGLGSHKKPDLLRLVWANGVPQNRIAPEPRQRIVEEQVLKGSCPFLYTYTGSSNGETNALEHSAGAAKIDTADGIEFVTDLLWGAPIGMPVADGIYAEADPHELVVVQGAVPHNGSYDLRITEELWEAAYFDQTKLWVVDHPSDTEATSSLRVFPGPAPPQEDWPDKILLAGDLKPVTAWDGKDRDVTEQVRERDHIYADGYTIGRYQGISEPWTFTFDLGEAPASPVRLVLDGWIFPSDASINVASSQRNDINFTFTRLEVETPEGWQVLLDPMGFPAGKTKTTIVDTPALPKGASKLRMVTSRWLHWDRIAWSTVEPVGTDQRVDERATVVARLEPSSAQLQYRGFSELIRRAPNAPHEYNYQQLRQDSPWIPFPGRYTRFGDVREALIDIDGDLVVMAAGDELRLLFDASNLPPVQEGYRRTIFLESYGWDKDADRNTLDADRSWPLPAGTARGEGRATEKHLTRVVTADSR